MTLHEKKMTAIRLEITPPETLKAFDPVILENRGGMFILRKADLVKETPHAILNSDAQIDGDKIYVPSWWHQALVNRYNAEHDHA